MAKINNRGIYGNIGNPSLLDFLLGTKEENGSTKSFPLQSIIQLINGVNGKNNIQYQFSDGSDPDIDYTSSGTFFTNNNSTSLPSFTELIFNKENLQPFDLSLLFNKIGESDNIVLKLEHPENPNIFFNLKVVSFEDHTEYFVFGVQPFKNFYLGSLENEKIYSLYFDIKSSTSNEDKFTSIGTVSLSGNNALISTGFSWEIDGSSYSNPTIFSYPISFSSTGKQRFILFAANVFNGFDVVSGPESLSNPIVPALPNNTLQVTLVLVTDGTISQPQPPEVNGSYVQKSEQYPIPVTGGGGGTFTVDSEKGYFEISNYSTHIVNIEDQQGYIYLGREISFRNTGTQDLTFQHNAIASEMNKKYFTFPGEENFILKPRELLTLKLGSNGRLNYVGASDPRKMDKAIYDTTDSGIVDGAEGLVRVVFAQEAIAKGDPVYVSNTGDPTFVMRARADNNAKMPAFGVAHEDIASGATGKVTINGSIRGLNTGSLDLGKNIYVGETGGITSTKPTTNAQIIGVSIETDASDGVIVIDPQPIADVDQTIINGSPNPVSGNAVFEGFENIYQPDTVVRYTAPTRASNTFTFPSAGYDVLLSKVLHTNTSQLVTTITAATTDFKRVDLIYFKADDTIAKIQGTESTTVAIRPDVPAGGVGLCFINIFGATIESPTPIDNTISVQDSLGIEKFKITDYIRFRGVSFNAGAKQIEVDPTVPLSVFLDIVNGNDATATLENAKKPFKTFNALFTSLPTFAGETYTIFMTGGTVAITRKLTMRNLRFVAYTPVTLDFTNVKENDGVTEAVEVFSNYAVATWTFENSNISIISNYVGQKSFSIYSQSGITMKGAIDIFNWKSINNLNSRGTVLENGTDLTINRLYDSSQNTVIFSEINNINLVINNFYPQYNRRLNGTNNNNCTAYIKNIIGPGATTISVDLNCLLVKVGNVSTFTGTLRPSSKTVEITGTIVDTCTIDFLGCPIVSGNITSNTYHTNTYIGGGTQIFRNFTGKLTAILCAATGRVSFENCIINVKDNLIFKYYFSPGYSDNSSIDDIVSFKGSNTIIQDSTTGNMLMHSNPAAPLNLRTIQIDDFGTTKTNVVAFGKTVKYVTRASTFKEKISEVVIRSKDDLLLRTLSSSTTYIIDGIITLLTGEYIEVPPGGLTMVGYGFDVSQINKNVSGQSIFTSPAGNSGNFVTRDIQYNSGLGSVFNLTDNGGTHAIEINDVNFQSCASLGTFNGYRQFTATTCGFYGCSDGFTLEGTWNGFKITNSNVIGFGASGTFIKKGASTSFNNRLYVDLNVSIASGSKICDFQDSNFASNKLLQVVNCLVKVNGVIDPATTGVTFPNISPFSAKAYFTNNIGVKNSFNEPYGLKTTNLSNYANDAAAASGGVEVGEVYVETSTGYFKVRLS